MNIQLLRRIATGMAVAFLSLAGLSAAGPSATPATAPTPSPAMLPAASGSARANPGTDGIFRLTVLHLNDFHGMDYDRMESITTLIRGVRKEVPAVVLLNGGDTFTRGPYQQYFRGELEFDLFNLQGTDALVLGNNEFKGGYDAQSNWDVLNARIAQAKFPVLAANVLDKETGKPMVGTKPWVILNRGGIRIGVLGLTTTTSTGALAGWKLVFQDEIAVAKQAYAQLAPQCEIVIALTHIGFDQDKALADEVPGLSAIIGAHSHTTLSRPTYAGPSAIPIVQAGENGGWLGRLDLEFTKEDGQWVLSGSEGRLLDLNRVLPAQDALDLVNKWMKSLEGEDEAAS